MLKKVRITSQIVFFAIFSIFFFLFNVLNPEAGSSALAWFLRINPFSVLITSLASRSIFLPYLVVGGVFFILTALFGRFFCGMICPLGSLIDISDKLFRGKERRGGPQRRATERRIEERDGSERRVKERRIEERRGLAKVTQPLRPPIRLQRLKYIFLIALFAMAFLGVTVPLFMDPLCLVPRIFGILFRPAIASIIASFGIGGEKLLAAPIVAKGAYNGAMTVFILFLIVLLGGIFDRRFWCQYICPTGAFLGIFSRFSFFTRKIHNEKCKGCGICTTRNCPTRAIYGETYERTSTAECILCGQCTADRRKCNAFSFSSPLTSVTKAGADVNRRQIITGVLGGLICAPLVTRFSKKMLRKNIPPLRPPGAVEENAFLDRCITCGACISVCPERALHPATLSNDGMVNWNTPKLIPRIGYCAEECTKCSHACPTGALVPIALEEKKKRKIGTAVVDRSLCRPWLEENKCMVCFKKCAYDAIDEAVVELNGKEWKVPEVNKRKCVGCGICEHYCPVKQEAAIQVFSHGEKRIKVYAKKKTKKS